jgi:hypothetical protein
VGLGRAGPWGQRLSQITHDGDKRREQELAEHYKRWWGIVSVQGSASVCYYACVDFSYGFILDQHRDYVYLGAGVGNEKGVSLSIEPALSE